MEAEETATGPGAALPDSESRRKAIERRARAEAAAHDELDRIEGIERRLLALRARAGAARRLLAALAGSRAVALLAGDRSIGEESGPWVEGRAAELRQRRFRLARLERVLEGGLAGLRAERPQSHTSRGGSGAPGPHAQEAAFRIRIAGRDWESARRGGDAALARTLAQALEERGQRTVVRLAREAGGRADVELTLRGRPTGEPRGARLNVLWLISHPDDVNDAELERYDRVLVASRQLAAQLSERLSVPVEALPQFTDPAVFRPARDPSRAHEVLFVGNWRGEFRRIVWDAIEADHPPALYGRGWDLLAPQHAVAEHVPHDELRSFYSSCEILLCDHWDDMRRHGIVSNRVFDALASGAFVLSDDNQGLSEELPGAVETYSTPAELGAKLDRYLANPEARRQMAERGRELVLAEHTAERRAERLLAIVADALSEGGRPADGASAAATAPREAGAGWE